ncbi:MAG: hypoxanthine phosphoribosyltransferase [Desulfobacterales bacterium]|nr:hypoxanthine phosphoribosyltransferase [Desulfobacterales bacterium]
MPELIKLFSQEDIENKIADIARQISISYKDKQPVFIGVLKGAFLFFADLVKRVTIPIEIDFIGISTYGKNNCSGHRVKVTKHIETDIKDRHILIVEDIIDTGLTLQFLINYLAIFHPKTIHVCALIEKHEQRIYNHTSHYVCYHITEGFVVGYGLDYAENYRNLPAIYRLFN